MKKVTKKFLSLALAGVMVSGVGAAETQAHAENATPETTITQVDGILEYTVKDGDTLGRICEIYYGNAGYWEVIAEYNHMKNPNKLQVGDKILLPNAIEQAYVYPAVVLPEYEEDTAYIVKSGDTLDCITRVQYGTSAREYVDKLATYNGLSDPNKIRVNQVLYIPCEEKLLAVVANDYTAEYNAMGERLWRMEHPFPWNCYPWNERPHHEGKPCEEIPFLPPEGPWVEHPFDHCERLPEPPKCKKLG